MLVIYADGQGRGFFYSKLGISFYGLQEQGTDWGLCRRAEHMTIQMKMCVDDFALPLLNMTANLL